MNYKNTKGQALVMAILLMMFLAITIPALVWWSDQDTKQGVREKKTTTAFHLAEGGIDRARWKLLSDTTIWNTLASGPIAGYAFDTEYTDAPGGVYAVWMSSNASNTTQRVIYASGRDATSKEVRTIKLVLTKPVVGQQAQYGANSDYFQIGGTSVHWGPIYANHSIDVGNANLRYPRKYSTSGITPASTALVDHFCSGAIGGTSCRFQNGPDYFAYATIPPQTTIDLASLKATAQGQGRYFASLSLNNAKPGSGAPLNLTVLSDPSNCTAYIDGAVTIQGNNFIPCNLIEGKANSSIHIQNGAVANVYPTTPPTQAYLEYQQFDTVATSEYPADNGLASVNNTYTFGQVGCTAAQWNQCQTTPLAMHGYMYTGGDLETQDTFTIYGSIYQAGGSGYHMQNSGGFTTFFDPVVTNFIPVVGGSISQVSWNEVPAFWPGTLP